MKKILLLLAVVLFLGITSAPVRAEDPPKKKDQTACSKSEKDKKCTAKQDSTKKCCKKDAGSSCKDKTKK